MDKKDYKELIEIEVYKGASSLLLRLYLKHIDPVTNAAYLFRKMQLLNNSDCIISKLRVLIIKKKLARRYGILASPDAIIGKGLRFVHPTSVVIGAHVQAGENLSVYQNTTIGGARTGDVNKGNQPHLGDNVTLFANSLVLGKLKVGSNVTIGANSLLLTSVPDDCVCVGSPARIINYKGGN